MTMLGAREAARRDEVLDDDVDILRDRGLVLAAQAGDPGAFDDLYARYHLRLWRFCMKRLQDEHEAEDVVQEAFVRAWRTLPAFVGERRFYPWLSVIAANLCTNLLRRRNRSKPVGDFTDRDLMSWDHWGEEAVIGSFDASAVARAFAKLSPRHRQILELRESRGWSYQQIADHEGVPISTVESRLWRARSALKREFTREVGAGPVAGLMTGLGFAIRRWGRWACAAGDRGAAMTPAANAVALGPAAVAAATTIAVTAVAAAVGSMLPGAIPAKAPDPWAGHPGSTLLARLSDPVLPVRNLQPASPDPVGPAASPGSPSPALPPSVPAPAEPPPPLSVSSPSPPAVTPPTPPPVPSTPAVAPPPQPSGITATITSSLENGNAPVSSALSSAPAPLPSTSPASSPGGSAVPDSLTLTAP